MNDNSKTPHSSAAPNVGKEERRDFDFRGALPSRPRNAGRGDAGPLVRGGGFLASSRGRPDRDEAPKPCASAPPAGGFRPQQWRTPRPSTFASGTHRETAETAQLRVRPGRSGRMQLESGARACRCARGPLGRRPGAVTSNDVTASAWAPLPMRGAAREADIARHRDARDRYETPRREMRRSAPTVRRPIPRDAASPSVPPGQSAAPIDRVPDSSRPQRPRCGRPPPRARVSGGRCAPARPRARGSPRWTSRRASYPKMPAAGRRRLRASDQRVAALLPAP